VSHLYFTGFFGVRKNSKKEKMPVGCMNIRRANLNRGGATERRHYGNSSIAIIVPDFAKNAKTVKKRKCPSDARTSGGLKPHTRLSTKPKGEKHECNF